MLRSMMVLVVLLGIEAAAAEPTAEISLGVHLEEVARFDKGGTVYDVAVLPDGKRALIGGDMVNRQMLIWDIGTHKTIKRIDRFGVVLQLSPDGRRLAISSTGTTAEVIRLETDDSAASQSFRHGHFLSQAVFAPDGKTLATAGLDGSVAIWNIKTGEELLRFKEHEGSVSSVVFSLDGMWIASAGIDQTIHIWDPQSGRVRSKIALQEPVWCLALSPDGKRLAAGTGGPIFGLTTDFDVLQLEENPIHIYDMETGEHVRSFDGHTHLVRDVAFSPDGKLIASASFDKSLRLWDVETAEELDRANGEGWFLCVEFTRDGRHVLCGGGAIKEGVTWIEFPEERLRLFRVHRGPNAEPAADSE